MRLLLIEDGDGIDMVDRSVRRALTAAIASSSSTSWSRASGEKATRQMKLAQRDAPFGRRSDVGHREHMEKEASSAGRFFIPDEPDSQHLSTR
ncbi:hypothetical protein WS63_03605 [Burkholderia stagnalis]|nr:hypothetical protein WS63_03605 [Burkholderia stagnalis]